MNRLMLLFLALPLFFVGCSGSSETTPGDQVQINPEFAQYIGAFTGGTVKVNDPIKVQFNEAISAEVREANQSGLFTFEPAAAGEVEWIDDRTVAFQPTEPFESGIRYKAEVDISEIVEPEKEELEVFAFNFHTRKKSIRLEIDRFQTYDESDNSLQKMIGKLHFNGLTDTANISRIIEAKQDGENLKINYFRENESTYGFIVENIVRKEQRSTLELNWSGAPVDIELGGKKTIRIPSINEFVVLDYEVNHSPEQYVKIYFSDPLESGQFLEGLIYLKDHDVKIVADGQIVIVYPEDRIVGDEVLKISKGVQNYEGARLSEAGHFNVFFEDIAPDIELIGEGNIIPKTGEAHFPFQSVNLTAVDVSISKIYEDNIIQFLQVNNYDGTYQLRRVSREVYEERIDLDPEGELDLHEWNNFSVDLSKYVEMDPGAIYRVKISARKEYSLYDCQLGEGTDQSMTQFNFTSVNEPWNEDDWESGYYYYDYNDYDYEYRYSERDDPCKDSFYRNMMVSRNVLVSDIGVIAKAGADKEMHIVLTDLNTTEPLSGASIKFYDYQQQFLGEATTDGDGMSITHLDRKPFVVVAEKNGQRGYLKLMDGDALSMSKFDVSGETVQHGVKGFVYTERGVWRPGDSLFISFMLEDKEDLLPESHPVVFEFINPKGIVLDEQIATHSVNGLYDFRTATHPDDITGNYSARITIGNRKFYKNIKVESVKPNRLKVDLSFEDEILSNKTGRNVTLKSKWLHGATAGDLKTKVDIHLKSTRTQFDKYNGFVFDDPIKGFTSESKTIFEGRLDEFGQVKFDHGISLTNAAPGMLKAYFTTKVFEKGGEFSIDRTSVVYSPYSEYAGLRVPEGSLYGGALLTDKNHYMDIVTVSETGKPVSSEVKVQVYKLSWRWWWDSYENDVASYISRTGTVPIQTQTLQTNGGKASFKFRVDQPEWGRYLVLVEDRESGHTTGKIVYVDWPYYARSNRKDSENATMLSFATDKEKYIRGEEVTLSIPTPDAGKALVSLESGTKIIDKFWVDTEKGETTVSFPTTGEMDPNVFVHVTLIQPYKAVTNDLPIRMYGVVPIYVEDPETHVEPIISMPDVLRPESYIEIKVSEKSKKPMTYTLAIVDEGLLDLTNFKTPDPWSHFNAREALGVKTWDMYDYVLGTYAEELDKLLAIGGDEDGSGKKAAKANRFEPMVRFIGPFEYDGSTNTHKIDVPNYVGSVRVMVVAGEEGTYGQAEKTVPVRSPLMVLGTLPRVLGPGEQVTLPANIFAMEKGVNDVSVTIKTNDLLAVNGAQTKRVKFSKQGDKIVNFDLRVAEETGIAKVSIIATGGGHKAQYDIELDVRTPNMEQTKTVEKVLNTGESFSANVDYFGVGGTNQAYLEVSNFPPLDLGRRLDYLIKYPHGCIEQTTSSVFPQLFLDELTDVDASKKMAIQQNINNAIDRIKLFQTTGGGFAYWPGGGYSSEWGTNYAGHFLLEAEKKGYSIPKTMKNGWLKFQKKQAKSWNKANQNVDGPQYNDLTQAYRLYTLALAGKPELGLMNRLRERGDLSIPAKWRLAAAYKLAGQREAAFGLVKNVSRTVPEYVELSYTFGSNARDEAMILETLVLLNMKTAGAEMARKIANRLNEDRWMNTQATAYSLLAVSRFLGKNKAEENLKFNFEVNGQRGKRDTEVNLVNFDLGEDGRSVKVENGGKGVLYVRLITKGVPLGGNEEATARNIQMAVRYFDMKNRLISVDELEQGQDFYAEIKVSNPGTRGNLRELALSHIVPSGWEIHNNRMDEFNSNESAYFTYQDIRDDRLYTYFDLNRNQTKTFKVQLNSSYLGKFYLPGIVVEAMYDHSIYARSKGQWVEVKQEDKVDS